MRWARLAAAVALCALLLRYPAQALEAAREAMGVWAGAFAPALFPFFVIMPALCGDAASGLYERLLGGAMGALFGCPGRAAAAVTVGAMAGSPPGASALKRVKGGMTRAEATRALILCSGLSPAFMIASVGGAMLGDAGAGRVLFRAHLAATLASGLIFRRAFSGEKRACEPAPEKAASAHPVAGAVVAMLNVCGWMVCFSVLAKLAAEVAPSLALALPPVLEIAFGCWKLAGAPLGETLKLSLMGFACGLGGLAVFMQNSAQMPEVKARHLALGKLVQGALCAGFVLLQTALPSPPGNMAHPLKTCLWLGCALTVAVALASTRRKSAGAPG